MAPAVSYQSWASGSYNWLDTSGSTAAPQEINSKLSTWVTAVNANASNTNKQITVTKSPSSSTSANFVGWVIQAASNATDSGFYSRLYSSTTTNLICTFSAGFTDNGTNGGYGAASGSSTTDTSISWATSGVSAEFAVASETTNGQEFFAIGWRLNNLTTQSDQFLIYKDTAGEWASFFSDGGTTMGSFYMGTSSTAQRCYTAQNPTSINTLILDRFVQSITSSATHLATAGSEMTVRSVAASSDLLYTSTSGNHGFGKWANISGGKTAVCLGLGPLFVSYVP